ncbi:hypothetical protein J5X84_33545 [Streptosporangiaceae bacterium NEAU-GS5]|nr:hypothetical protein [Streptosporangiaceae bacterium NEAU-GS5]
MTAEGIPHPHGPTWIGSLGGPLIVMPESALPLWHGSPIDAVTLDGDYGRACAIPGFIGLIPVGPRLALVLGDDPAATTFLSEYGLFIRLIAADSFDDAIRTAIDIMDSVTWDETLNWDIHEPLLLFDSVYNGAEVSDATPGFEPAVVRMSVTPGPYLVRAGYVHIAHTRLIVVQLEPHTTHSE